MANNIYQGGGSIEKSPKKCCRRTNIRAATRTTVGGPGMDEYMSSSPICRWTSEGRESTTQVIEGAQVAAHTRESADTRRRPSDRQVELETLDIIRASHGFHQLPSLRQTYHVPYGCEATKPMRPYDVSKGLDRLRTRHAESYYHRRELPCSVCACLD